MSNINVGGSDIIMSNEILTNKVKSNSLIVSGGTSLKLVSATTLSLSSELTVPSLTVTSITATTANITTLNAGATTITTLNAGATVLSTLSATNTNLSSLTVAGVTNLGSVASTSLSVSTLLASTNFTSTASTINNLRVSGTLTGSTTSLSSLSVTGITVVNNMTTGNIYANNIYSNGALISNSLYGSEYNYSELLGSAGTTSTNFQQRVSMTTSSLLGGAYKINIGYTYESQAIYDNQGIFNGLLDPTGLSSGNLIHKHVDSSLKGIFSRPIYSSVTKTLTPGIHFISLIYGTQTVGSGVSISNATIELFRVM